MVAPGLRQALLHAARPAALVRLPARPAARPAASIAHAGRQAQLAGLVATYRALCERIDAFALRRPDVAGVPLLRQRACRDLKFVRGLDGAGKGELRSAANNANGMNAELDVAESAPGVVGVCQKFRLVPSAGPNVRGARPAAPARAGPAVFPLGSKAVEVDVVAAGGSLWIEVKAHQAFGAGSQRASDMEVQAQLHVMAACAPWNAWHWAPPRVVYYSATGPWAPCVAARLRGAGALVAGPGPLGEGVLGAVPPAPAAANLDITTLCALVSELSHGAAHDAAAGAALSPGFQRSAEAERAAPLLPQLTARLDGLELVAAAAAVDRFDALVAVHGGPRERGRWAGLRAALRVVPDAPPGALPGRVARLEGLALHHAAVLGAAEAERALTLTANGHLIALAAAQGVRLPAHVHRSHYLTGR